MWLFLGILIDGAVTTVLAILIGVEWEFSPLFYVSLVGVHGFVAAFCIITFWAVRTVEGHAEVLSEAEADRTRREPKVVQIFPRPPLDQAA